MVRRVHFRMRRYKKRGVFPHKKKDAGICLHPSLIFSCIQTLTLGTVVLCRMTGKTSGAVRTASRYHIVIIPSQHIRLISTMRPVA